jgi:acetylornithine deacetylase/succinyl-diaminopimelate desuccinylase-like protein
MSDIKGYVAKHRERMMEELKELLRIPSISTTPANATDCRRAADWMAGHLRGLGCDNVELLGSDSHPTVVAEGPRVPGKPTVLAYGHYDVQPPDPLDEWDTGPFDPMIRDGNLYARGATDDKGQVFAIVKAFEAVSRGKKPPVNMRFIIEGQEETGSDVLTELLQQRPELVKGDAALVADTQYYAPGWPAIEVGLRGIVYGEIKVRTATTDLHSGLYGGAAPNAHETLVHLLAKLKTEKGRVRVPGLYEAVKRPPKSQRDDWDKLPFNERKFMRDEVGSKTLTGLTQYSVFERLWALPTFEIHGIRGGFTGEGAKTVIPAEATAKFSLRLVPNQKQKTVEKQVTKAVKQLAPKWADVSVSFIHGADPVLVDTDSRPFELIDQAFKEVEGRSVVLTRSGGSIPIVSDLGREGAPVLLAGIGLPDDRLHAPNEKLGVEQFYNGVQVFARFMELMGGK